MDEDYQRAKDKIDEALRRQSKELDLSRGWQDHSAPLTELPASLGALTKLEALNLSGNYLNVLPDWLGQLTCLKSLHLFNNRLRELPDSIGNLKELRSLSLRLNHLRTLPKSLGELAQLQTLDLRGNLLEVLPESLGSLAALQELHLYRNHLSILPHSIGGLMELRLLDVRDNRLTALPESLGQLNNLQLLNVRDNQLKVLPDTLGRLSQLQEFDLSNNRLITLPESLKSLKALKRLFLHDNPNVELLLTPDIVGANWVEVRRGHNPADPSAILAFYFSQRRQNAKSLNEVKLLLVGHGRVGKTSISKALRGVPHNEREPETPGIERHQLQLSAEKSKITAHIWDFGGQEFLHQTHQFFFSERSMYVVVLSGRQGRQMQEAEYWLRLIRTYGGGSPVVIALNKTKEHSFTVDEHFLQETYPEVKAVVKTDCHPRVGIKDLRSLLGKLAGSMPSVQMKIDPEWARVRKHLEQMKESYVTFERYRKICAGLGVITTEKQDTLATILDCLGIALNYRNDPRLRETSVLKPRWLVGGIYEILRWLHNHETNGEMRIEHFSKALRDKKTYPETMHRFLLALMEKFELCFPIEGEHGLYLVPALLDANQPRELKAFSDPKAQRIQFRYEDVRPPSLLPRFIVRSHTLSEGQPRWLRGAVIGRGSARALVRGDYEGRVTDVFALGDDAEDRIWLTEFILAEMETLNDKLPVRTLVESDSQPGAWTELELLREAARREQETRAERLVDGGMVMVNVRQTLRQIESPETSTSPDSALPVFICYSHANERTVKKLIPSLKVLSQRGYVRPWRDTELVPGEDWDDTIKDRLSNARIILFMVSRDFLASKYITEEERPLAMALMKKNKAVVVPILLSACSWREEDFARLEMLPHKDDPISSFAPREDAWALVEEGLKKVVDKVRSSSESRWHSRMSFTERASLIK